MGGLDTARECEHQFCQKCGRKGHGRRDCQARKEKRLNSVKLSSNASLTNTNDGNIGGVVIAIWVNGKPTRAMIDTGAQPSVMDEKTLDSLGLRCKPDPGIVRGVCATPIDTLGFVEVEIDLGNGRVREHTFTILDSPEPTVILGREFLLRFDSFEIDWGGRKVRLGQLWLETVASVQGGLPLARAEAVNQVLNMAEDGKEDTYDINSELDCQQKEKLGTLLTEFEDVFAPNPKKPSVTHLTEHSIVTGNAGPVRAKNIRVSPQIEKEINTQIQQMLENAIVRPSNSPWVSRVILVTKKDGTQRFAVDYRALNNCTKKDSYPIPEVRDILDKLKESRYFSTLDGASAYWSIPIAEIDREKTAFLTPRGQFEFCVMALVCAMPLRRTNAWLMKL